MDKVKLTAAIEYVIDINATIRSLGAKYGVSKTTMHNWIQYVAKEDAKLADLIKKKATGNHLLANARHNRRKVRMVRKTIMSQMTRIRLKGKMSKIKTVKVVPELLADFLWK